MIQPTYLLPALTIYVHVFEILENFLKEKLVKKKYTKISNGEINSKYTKTRLVSQKDLVSTQLIKERYAMNNNANNTISSPAWLLISKNHIGVTDKIEDIIAYNEKYLQPGETIILKKDYADELFKEEQKS